MNRKICIFICFLACCISSFAQEALTLDSCRQLAVDNYPLIKQYGLIDNIEKNSVSNITNNYLPQISLNAQATYQSDVTKISLDLPPLIASFINFPEMSKDQYRASIDVTQLIWDGGIVNAQRNVAKATSNVERQRIDVSLYTVKGQVDKLYFGILATNEQIEILDMLENELNENRKIVQSYMKNGVATESDLDLVDVELLNLEQNRTELTSYKKSLLSVLGLLIHRNLDENTKLIKPQEEVVSEGVLARPELRLFDLQNTLFKTQNNAIFSKNMPRIGLFVQGGYGRPGLNMLDDQFKFYTIGGVKLTWNFSSLYSKGNDQRLIDQDKKGVEVQRETFLFNTNMELTKQRDEVQKLKDMMQKDDEIIALRNRVKLASESKYKNGVYKLTDLLRDITAENQARQVKSLREIQYLMSIQDYKQIQGTP